MAKRFPLHASLDTTYAYDLGGRLTDADNTAADIHFTHDALNRATNATDTLNLTPYTLSYAYDNAGNRTHLVYPSGKTLDYSYDVNDRMDLVKVNTVSLSDYEHDPLDRRITKTYNLTPNNLVTSYQFDIANQLSQIKNEINGGSLISQYDYTLYDNVGNRKTLQFIQGAQPQQTINYAYNNIYEIANVSGDQTHSYDYDSVANREMADGTSYTANNLNQYTSVGATTYLYDGNGNLVSDGTNTYTYDELNRLLTFSNGITNASYTYDAFDRRISKTVNGVTTYFIYDDSSVIAEYDSLGGLNAEYVLGDQVDEILTMERGGNTYFYFYDGLGSVSEITDNTGAIAENYTYDVYGNPSIINSTIGNRYRFTGQEFDEESGLHHFNARTYNSLIGRLKQRDPIGFEDGMNLYRYVSNNPINFIDPSGEVVLDLISFGVDVYFFQESLSKFKECKNFGTTTSLAIDTLSFLPFVPTLGLLTRSDSILSTSNAIIKNIKKGKGNKVITEVKGGKQDAAKLFNNLRTSKPNEVSSGVFVAPSKKGGFVTFRPKSASGPPTVDINPKTGVIEKIKFLEN